jgi:hypothetical protein
MKVDDAADAVNDKSNDGAEDMGVRDGSDEEDAMDQPRGGVSASLRGSRGSKPSATQIEGTAKKEMEKRSRSERAMRRGGSEMDS